MTHSHRPPYVEYTHCPPSSVRPERLRQRHLSQALEHTLDRVNVLGDDSYGHTGCVNALSWARDGQVLLSGGDDTTVRIWGIDAADTSTEYPFVCHSVIHTGHRANVFSTQMLPYSTRIATVAGDKQVRVFDVGEAAFSGTANGRETSYSSRQACTHILRCHTDRVKRIVTEHSPDLFLTVGEDGSVRQHDLRTPHNCRQGPCPAPLVKVNHELSTLTLSPLTPYQFVAAGEAPYGYLFDRRHIGRELREEWGVPEAADHGDSLVTCVRRFGKPKTSGERRRQRPEYITGARMSGSNGHEVLLSFSGDGAYLYSTYDNPKNEESARSSPTLPLPSNAKRRRIEDTDNDMAGKATDRAMDVDEDHSSTVMDIDSNATEHSENRSNEEHDDDDDDNEYEDDEEDSFLEIIGASGANEEDYYPATIKDVNFLGPSDEFVTSGSDDGNFFVWDKVSGALRGIYEGDSTVVNMVEGHPHLPLVAVSGIDTTVKLFAPTGGSSGFSRMENSASIMEANARQGTNIRYSFATLLAEARLAMGDEAAPECRNQ